MDLPSFALAPAPVEVAIGSALSPADALQRLSAAVDERRYSRPDRFSSGFLRLGGSIAATNVRLTARPYVTPGLVAGYGAMTIELRGEVVEREDGSELRGTISAPVRWTTPASLVIAWAAWVGWGIAGNGSIWPTWLFVAFASLLMAAAWTWAVRHNQRMALRHVHDLQRTVRSILSDGGREAGDIPGH